jgi:hypothetical protein
MNDAELDQLVQKRLNEIRSKLQRISGHENLSAKQLQSLKALVQESESLTGGSSIDELFK